jgi:predicted CoA-binding protein
VNPAITELLGKKAYPSIAYIPERIGVVDVFRKLEDIQTVIEDVLKELKEKDAEIQELRQTIISLENKLNDLYSQEKKQQL